MLYKRPALRRVKDLCLQSIIRLCTRPQSHCGQMVTGVAVFVTAVSSVLSGQWGDLSSCPKYTRLLCCGVCGSFRSQQFAANYINYVYTSAINS